MLNQSNLDIHIFTLERVLGPKKIYPRNDLDEFI